jgi:hypothetical protein
LAPKRKSLAGFGKSLSSVASNKSDARARRAGGPFDPGERSPRENESARMTGSIVTVLVLGCAAFMAGVHGRRAATDRPKKEKEK